MAEPVQQRASEVNKLCLRAIHGTHSHLRSATYPTLMLRSELHSLRQELLFLTTVMAKNGLRWLDLSLNADSDVHLLLESLETARKYFYLATSSTTLPANCALWSIVDSHSESNQDLISDFETSKKELLQIRLDISHAHKQVWSSMMKRPPNIVLNAEANLYDPLSKKFLSKPFEVTPFDVYDLGDANSYLPWLFLTTEPSSVEITAKEWFLQGFTEPQEDEKWEAHQERILMLFWSCTLPILRQPWRQWLSGPSINAQEGRVYTAPEQLEASISQLDNDLRDTLLRRQSKRTKMAFVGSQSSGKSTLINYIVGHEVLPTDVEQATSYPCRIRHLSGQTEPILEIDVEYLNSRIQMVGRLELSKRLADNNWKGHRIAQQEDSSLSLYWLQKIWNREPNIIKVAESGKFSLQPVSIGRDRVLETLRYVNDLVRVCHLLDIPFESFAESRWATINVEISHLKSAGGEYEMIDLPGFAGVDGEIFWEELIREVLREVEAIVAVVPSMDVLSNSTFAQSWRRVPDIIAAGSNLSATAVILTKIDKLQSKDLDDSRRHRRIQEIREEFYPNEQFASDLPIWECSVAYTNSAKALIESFEKDDKDVDISKIWETPESEALRALYVEESNFQSAYELSGLQGMKTILQNRLATWKSEETIKSLVNVFKKVKFAYSLNEARGIATRIQRSMDSLEESLLKLNLIARDRASALLLHTQVIKQGESLRNEWRSRQSRFEEDCRRLFLEAQESLSQGFHFALEGALDSTRDAQNKGLALPELSGDLEQQDTVSFSSQRDVAKYVANLQRSLLDSLQSSQRETVQSLERSILAARSAQLKDLGQAISLFDSTAEERLSSLALATDIHPNLPPNPIPDGAFNSAVETTRISNESIARREHYATQQRVLRWLRPNDASLRVEELSPLLRFLLRWIAIIPYFLTLPLRIRRSKTIYLLDLEKLRNLIREAVEAPWTDATSNDLQKKLQKEATRGTDIIEEAISYATTKSDQILNETASHPTTPLGDGVIQSVIAIQINMLAMESCQQSLISILSNQTLHSQT